MLRTSMALAVAAASLALAAPAGAAPVLDDNFDGENGGLSQRDYTGFANFAVTGLVDLVANGDFGITCAGSCVDLDGSSAAGTLRSSSFAFNAGDLVRLDFDIGGAQRGQISDSWFGRFVFGSNTLVTSYGLNFGGSDFDLAGGTFSGLGFSAAVSGNDPFLKRSIFFTAGEAGLLKFEIGTDSTDSFGPLLDNVRLDISPAGAVPEPATWAMMILGFGLVGGTMRQRKTTAAAAIA